MDENKKFFSKIGANYLILAVLSVIFQTLLVNITILYNPNLIQNMNILTMIGAISNYILPLPIFIFLMFKLEPGKIEEKRLSPLKLIQYICITITLMWVGSIIGTIITTLIGITISNEITNPIQEMIQNSSIYINFIILSIIAPLFEEMFFRKFLIDRTIKYGATLSIILSATLFALFHGNFSQFFYALFLGGFFAYVYIKTGKIRYTIILHMIINFIGTVMSLIFIMSLNNIKALNPFDITIVAIYASMIIFSLIVGLYTIFFNLSEIDLKDYKEITLESPVKTVLLNVGMILFIVFHIFLIFTSVTL